jgi:hypothetical protein
MKSFTDNIKSAMPPGMDVNEMVDIQREFLTQWREMVKEHIESDPGSEMANQLTNMWIKAGLRLIKMQDDAVRHAKEVQLEWIDSYLEQLDQFADQHSTSSQSSEQS